MHFFDKRSRSQKDVLQYTEWVGKHLKAGVMQSEVRTHMLVGRVLTQLHFDTPQSMCDFHHVLPLRSHNL